MPNPIIYDEDNNPHKLPENLLPVKLPEVKKLDVTGNSLDKANDWKNIEINGKKYRRETDTLDTFVDSSWYFLRFCSPKNKDYGFSYEDINYWMPVDQYIGEWSMQYCIYCIQDFYASIIF